MRSDQGVQLENIFLERRDLESFKSVYKKYYKRLCFFAHQYLKDEGRAVDIVQDVFMQIWDGATMVTDASKLQGYLYMMVRNKCLNVFRSDSNFQKYIDQNVSFDELEEDESIRLVKAEVYSEILQRIDNLPDRAKEVFKLSYLTQLREGEIAERLGISVNSVKTHKKRAKEILKDDLRHIYPLLMILFL